MIPVLDAYRTHDGLLAVWCDHELRWHWHGGCNWNNPDCPHGRKPIAGIACTCPPGTGNGHRLDHCECPTSPYRATGYTLREIGRFTSSVKAARKVHRGANCPGAECIANRALTAEQAWRFAYGQDVLEVACPKCATPAGEKCHMKRGHVHTARYDARMRIRSTKKENV